MCLEGFLLDFCYKQYNGMTSFIKWRKALSCRSVAVLSKAWVYGRSLTGIVGSNPA
jgi:hypothetical protein